MWAIEIESRNYMTHNLQKRYTNSITLCASAQEVNIPGVEEDKYIHFIPKKKNYDINSRPSEESTASTADWVNIPPNLHQKKELSACP